MSKISVTYHAPAGDLPFVDMRGVRFFDKQPQDLSEADPAFVSKLRGNPHFEVVGGDQEEPSKPAGLVAKHRGRGVYGVFDGAELLDQLPGMTKDEADAFNALSDEDKAAFVDKPADPAPQPAPAT